MVTCTDAFGSPVPVTVATLVIRSVADAPVSDTSATVTGGTVVSSVNASVALALLPARSVSLTTTLWLPSASTGAKLQAPVAASPVAT